MTDGQERPGRMDGRADSVRQERAPSSPFASVVFAGGGTRCFWQVGFWTAAVPRLGLAPRRVAAVSAGAAMACVLLAGRAREGLEYFKAATGVNRRNVYPLNALRGRPVFPHAAMYRHALVTLLDEQALARLRAGPQIRIAITRAPRWLGPRAAFAAAGLAELVENAIAPAVHPRLARRLGFAREYAAANECATADALADLILASSCTPPFTPLMTHAGRPALDGGIADNVPVDAVAGEAPTLVLLTRRYDRLPSEPSRVYLQPAATIPIAPWDYTDPRGVQAAYDLGRHDGERFQLLRPPPI